MSKARQPPLVIRYWETGVNLVTDAKWSADFIDEHVAEHIPRNRDAMVLFNNAKMFGGAGSQPPKCRIYWRLGGQILTCIPAVESFNAGQVDFQHQLNDWMRKNFGVGAKLGAFFDEYDERFETREERRQAAKKAAKKMKKVG